MEYVFGRDQFQTRRQENGEEQGLFKQAKTNISPHFFKIIKTHLEQLLSRLSHHSYALTTHGPYLRKLITRPSSLTHSHTNTRKYASSYACMYAWAHTCTRACSHALRTHAHM